MLYNEVPGAPETIAAHRLVSSSSSQCRNLPARKYLQFVVSYKGVLAIGASIVHQCCWAYSQNDDNDL